MKKNLLYNLITAFAILSVNTASAQGQSDRTAYVVTDSIKIGMRWNFLRSIDLRTGTYSNTLVRLLNSNDLQGNGVAAITHDKKGKRVYFTPMLTDHLSYVDLRTMRVYVAKNNFTGLMPKAADQSNVITRMVIADDEFGYALTNDGKHLFRFTTRNNPVVNDLGPLIDAPGNNENSVHNACSSYGGDLIADDENHLYLITIRNHVFKINIRTRVARFLGTISGLPENFSTTSAAVDQTGTRVIIISSVDASDVYSLNMNSLVAVGLGQKNVFHTADLGGAGILKNRRNDLYNNDYRLITINDPANDNIQLFPNPVTGNKFTIHFSDTDPGKYNVEMIDIKGQIVVSTAINTSGKNSTVAIDLPSITAKGVFIVRVTGKNSKIVFSEKIVLQ